MIRRLLGWVKRHLRAVLVAGGVLMVLMSFAAYRTWDYIQNDPDFCTSCHLMDDAFARWEHSGHRDINCHTCHPGDLASNAHQLWVQLTKRPTEVRKHAEVPAEICGQCHLSDDPKWRQVAETAGHRLHWVDERIECVTCHAPAVHDFVPTDAMCQKCHGDVVVGLDAMARNHCTSCHEFLVGPASASLIPTGERCASCHADVGDGDGHDPQWHAGIDCTRCHPVHDPVSPALAAPDRDGAAAPCVECHADEDVPSPPPHDECTACHAPHQNTPGEAACGDCHEAIADVLAGALHHGCTDCHPQHLHDPPPAAESCAGCHRSTEALKKATKVEAHTECVNCHDPHDPAAPDGPACAACHADEARASARAPQAAHRRCTSCHAVHDPERRRDCANCHAEQRAATRAAPRAHQACGNCHAEHGSPKASTRSCLSCHAEQARVARAGPVEHATCEGCHDPHRPTRPRPNVCGDCHEDVARLLTRSAPEHRDCVSCHGWHRASLAVGSATCAGCHGEQASARHSVHPQCEACHPPHAARRVETCDDCHGRQARAARRAKSAAHRDCASCHGETHATARANGAATCRSCHGAPEQYGLHAVMQHRDCDDCHEPHGPSKPTAAACTGCHPPEAIPRHPPEARGATTCHGCHNFRRRTR